MLNVFPAKSVNGSQLSACANFHQKTTNNCDYKIDRRVQTDWTNLVAKTVLLPLLTYSQSHVRR